jgi:hypothetical protein
MELLLSFPGSERKMILQIKMPAKGIFREQIIKAHQFLKNMMRFDLQNFLFVYFQYQAYGLGVVPWLDSKENCNQT